MARVLSKAYFNIHKIMVLEDAVWVYLRIRGKTCEFSYSVQLYEL